MKKNICVLGSINIDLTLRVDRMVKSGETILSKGYKKTFGGKGANQALAAKLLGADVTFIGRVGNDENGIQIVKSLEKNDIDISNIKFIENSSTGMAVITVDDYGSNSIIVVPGANMDIDRKVIIEARESIINSKILVSQFETPLESTIEAFKIAKENGVITLLNPAPAKQIPDELLRLTDIIVPNETEAFEITNIEIGDNASMIEASKKFIKGGVKFVIITLGEKGATLISENNFSIVPAYKVKSIDTTAAGDSFIGALASRLLNEENLDFKSIESAMKFANKVSSIVVQKEGAQSSLPILEDVLKVYKNDL
ncbi:ribokinase [Clostridium psychrophilum]|uniref:ribokinase n=1 Tax=Clostridium psychrophilum TaxID=132926 RepID=UPI001C0BEB8A|nr:ribokinase [Clostridium psychrophilum]MBU3181981.1 ribokinase [Clostridium psychrophilum]